MIGDELLERVESGGLIAGPGPLLAMVSGGRDSVCMLDLAVRARGAEAVSALHVNYALRGVKPEDGRLARPLLGTTREEVTAYCEERGLAWRDDAGNEEADYKRNLLRRDVIPELEKIHPAAKSNVLRTATLLREEAELLDSLVEAELAGGEVVPAGSIAHSRFAELHPALRRLVLQRLADEVAGRPVPGAARFAEQVAGLSRGGSTLDLGSGVRAVLERGLLRAEPS